MNHSRQQTYIWRQFTTREALLLGFCATFIMLTRAGLRLHLHLPGHVMFFTMFFFLLARGFVPKIGSVALVGLITCLASTVFGMGNVGVMVLAHYLLPALVVEGFALLFPSFVNSVIACVAVGVIASAIRAAAASGLELLIGMEEEILMVKAFTSMGMNALFGGLGSLAVPAILLRLRKNGLIDRAEGFYR